MSRMLTLPRIWNRRGTIVKMISRAVLGALAALTVGMTSVDARAADDTVRLVKQRMGIYTG